MISPALNSACQTMSALKVTRQKPGEHAICTPLDIGKRGEDATVESCAHVPQRPQLDSAACADDKADLVVTLRRVAGESEQPGQERTRAPLAELLEASGHPVIDGNPPALRGQQPTAGDVDLRFLMRRQPFEPQAVMHRDVEHTTDRRRAIEIDGLVGDPLEEITADAIPGKRGNLNGLRRCDRGTRKQNRRQRSQRSHLATKYDRSEHTQMENSRAMQIMRSRSRENPCSAAISVTSVNRLELYWRYKETHTGSFDTAGYAHDRGRATRPYLTAILL